MHYETDQFPQSRLVTSLRPPRTSEGHFRSQFMKPYCKHMFLDIQGLREAVKVEAFNKKFWFLCQHWLAARQGPQQRFRDLITSIPEIRFVASALKKVPAEKLCLLFKVRIFAF